MPRYALKIEYDGTPFSGWQRQSHHRSVQQSIEDALRRLEADAPGIAGAGRTDTGVHAIGQVAHCDLRKDWDAFRLAEALNFHLRPDPVAVLVAARVDDNFHARFSAKERRYLFRLQARRAPPTFARDRVWHIRHPLALAPMQAAAAHLVGLHDFTTFRSTMCQSASPVKTLDMIEIEAIEIPHGTEFRFHLRARSFLHNQVRSIVGTLERVGSGAWHPEDVKTALQAANRAACGPVCPPNGLYLAGVGYGVDPFVTG